MLGLRWDLASDPRVNTTCCQTREVVCLPKWGFGVAMLPVAHCSIVLLLGACWAHGACKMANFGAFQILCLRLCFRAKEGMLPPSVRRESCASAKRIVFMQKPCHFLPAPPNPTPKVGSVLVQRALFLSKAEITGCKRPNRQCNDNPKSRNPSMFSAMRP